MTYSRCNTIHDELCRMVTKEHIPMEEALQTITSNVANRMGLSGRKGVITPGADADLVVWDDRLRIVQVYARGKLAYNGGKPLLKGGFE